MITDKEGNQLNIGDRVTFTSSLSGLTYVFTIEEERGEWVWGSDIPEGHCYRRGGGGKNFHKSSACTLIENKIKKPWEGSKIKFNFV